MSEKNCTQLELVGLPQASYPVRIFCSKCGHMAELTVGIDVLHGLHRLRCSKCGGSGRDIKVEISGRADLGGG